MKTIKIICFVILLVFVISWLIISNIYSINQDIMNLPNKDFSDITTYNDSLSDSLGNRAFPWGIEVWTHALGEGTLPESYFENGQVKLVGHGTTYIPVLAIPNPPNKPLVTPGLMYTQSFEVKLENVQGYGVRVMHQWFDSNDPFNFKIIGTDYGTFETGTSDWHTISLTKVAPPGAVTGDIIIELWGTGTVYIRNPRYHMTTILDSIYQIKIHDVFLFLVTMCVAMILLFGFRSLISLIIEARRGGKT